MNGPFSGPVNRGPLSIKEIVLQAFILGSGGTPNVGQWASVFQMGPIQSFAFFEGEGDDNMIYEAAVDAGTLEITPFDPPTTAKQQEVHAAVLDYTDRMKRARAQKWSAPDFE